MSASDATVAYGAPLTPHSSRTCEKCALDPLRDAGVGTRTLARQDVAFETGDLHAVHGQALIVPMRVEVLAGVAALRIVRRTAAKGEWPKTDAYAAAL